MPRLVLASMTDQPLTEEELERTWRKADATGTLEGPGPSDVYRLLAEVRRLRESLREVTLLARSALRRLGDEPENDLDPADMVRGLDKWLTDWSHGGTHPRPAKRAG